MQTQDFFQRLVKRVPMPTRLMAAVRALPALALVLLPGNLFAQREAPPVFTAESEVVRIDLIVSDKKGRFISDLQAHEIQVWEDGKKQKVTFFHQLGPGAFDTVPIDEEPLRLEEVPGAEPGAGAEPGQGAYFVVLLDLESLTFDSLLRTKRSLEEFFQSHLQMEDRVMLASIKRGLRIHQSFTNDLDKLRGALDQLSIRPQDSISILRFMDEVEGIFSEVEANAFAAGSSDDFISQDLELAVRAAIDTGRMLLNDLEMRVSYACHVISGLARHLGSLQGRKNVLFYSEGYPLDPGRMLGQIIAQRAGRAAGDSMAELQVTRMVDSRLGSNPMGFSKLQSAMNQANRFRVSLYSVDARGLLPPPGNAEHQYFADYPRLAGRELNAPQEFLTALAGGTGGLSFLNNNDLAAGLHQVYSDSRHYYLVGYTPDRKKKARKTHRIKMKLNRKGLTLRYRREYSESNADQLTSALRFPELFQDFPFEARVADREGNLTIRMYLPTRELSLKSHDGGAWFILEMFGALLDKSGQSVGKEWLFKRRLEHDFSSEFVARLRQSDTIDFTAEGKAPPGSYQLVVVLYQGFSGRIGTFVSDITVQP